MNVHSPGKQQVNLLTEENLVKKKFSREIRKNVESQAIFRGYAGRHFSADFSKKNARINGHFRPALRERRERIEYNSPVSAPVWQGAGKLQKLARDGEKQRKPIEIYKRPEPWSSRRFNATGDADAEMTRAEKHLLEARQKEEAAAEQVLAAQAEQQQVQRSQGFPERGGLINIIV